MIPLFPGTAIVAFAEHHDLTRDELAGRLDVSRQTLYRWIKNGAPVHIELALEGLGARLDEAGRE